MTPLLGVLVGAACTLLVIVFTVAVVVQRRNRSKRQRQMNNQSGEQQQTTVLNGANQPLLPLAHSLPGTDPNPGFGANTTGNVINGSNGGHVNEGRHQRAVLLNKTANGVNGQATHFNKLINSSRTKVDGNHQQDPDIILREIGRLTSWDDIEHQSKHG